MTRELRDVIKEASAVDDDGRSPAGGLAAVLRRGNALKRRRRFGVSLLTVSLVVGGVGIASAIDWPLDGEPGRLDIAQHRAAPAVDEDGATAVVVAVRALAEVGLLNPEGDLYDYRYAIARDGRWTIGFEAGYCAPTEAVSSCTPNPNGDAELVIEERNEEFTVVAASGPMSDEQRDALIGASERLGANSPHWEFPFATVAGPGQGAVAGSPLWVGPIPSKAYGSTCTPRIVDAAGETLWAGDPIDLGAPYREDMRSGQLQFQQPVPDGFEDHDAEFSCYPWNGAGWRVAGRASVARAGTEKTVVPVRVPVEWRGRSFADAYTQCVAQLTDDAGHVVGRGETTILPPRSHDAGSGVAQQVAEIPVRRTSPRDPVDAEVACSLIHRVEFAEEAG